MRFADDIAVLSESMEGLQPLINNTHKRSTRFGLQISTNKTEVQRIDRYPDVMIDNRLLIAVDMFVNLV